MKYIVPIVCSFVIGFNSAELLKLGNPLAFGFIILAYLVEKFYFYHVATKH